MLRFLDIFLFILHVVVITFNLTGWIWKPTRRAHLWVVGLTLGSWLLLGYWYGLGYCFLTDWHWNIKYKLGQTGMPSSFVQYFFESIGIQSQPMTTNWITGIAFGAAIVMTIYVHWKKINLKGSANTK